MDHKRFLAKIGKIGGSSTSPEKTAAVRENGKRGGRPRIQDEFTDLAMSRQQKWQLRQQKKHRCIVCGKPVKTKVYCRKHVALHNDRQNDRNRRRAVENSRGK